MSSITSRGSHIQKCASSPEASSVRASKASFSTSSSASFAASSSEPKQQSERRVNAAMTKRLILQYPNQDRYLKQLESRFRVPKTKPKDSPNYTSNPLKTGLPCKIAYNNKGNSFRVLSPPFARGGEKAIYFAVEVKTRRLFSVAISKLKDVPDAKKQLDFQAKLKLSHVVQYLDSVIYTGKKGNLKKIVWMEHFITDLLAQSISRESSPVKMNLYNMTEQSIIAILQLHEKGIEHGDIKPENFLLNETCVKVTDLDNSNFAFRLKNSLDLFFTGDYCSPELMIKVRLIEDMNQLRMHANNASAKARTLADTVTLMEQIEMTPEETEEVAKDKKTILELDSEAKRCLEKADMYENRAKNITVLFANDIFALGITLFIAKYQYNPMHNYFYYEHRLDLKQQQFPPLGYLDEATWSAVLEYAFKTPPKQDSFDALLMEMMVFDPKKRPTIASCLEKLRISYTTDPSSFQFKPISGSSDDDSVSEDDEDSVSEELTA